ncbi:MAG: class I tRNA ligase family protein [Candidatus Competibacteraceae bacterium]|nr:class I tRNA ligase family protein [Candidatus Competibacteraceae bacterium]
MLLRVARLQHSYPHCWRHKTPIIPARHPAMGSSAWINRTAYARWPWPESKKLRFTPDWGEARLQGMVENRPDWCVSRQRYWGHADHAVHPQADRRTASGNVNADGTSETTHRTERYRRLVLNSTQRNCWARRQRTTIKFGIRSRCRIRFRHHPSVGAGS